MYKYYGHNIDDEIKCENEVLEEVFKYIFDNKNDGKMVISHTPQFFYNLNINKSCNGRVWRLDTGMSRGFDEHYHLFMIVILLEFVIL